MAATDLRDRELITPRLRLRPLRREDAALIELYASDARVARMTARIPHPYPPGGADGFVRGTLAPDAREIVWAIDAGADGENGLVGLIGARPNGEDEAEIGYWVAPAVWGTGCASEAVQAVAAAVALAGLTALTAEAFQDNAASIRVLERTGFRRVGDGEAYCVARGGMVAVHRYRREVAAGAEAGR